MDQAFIYWVGSLERFAFQSARYTSHIEFLSSCLQLGVPPRGLNLKIPITGMPNSMRTSARIFGLGASYQLAALVFSWYTQLRNELVANFLLPAIRVCMNVPSLRARASAVLDRASRFLETKRHSNRRKLRQLIGSYEDRGTPLPTWAPTFFSLGGTRPPNIPNTHEPIYATHHEDPNATGEAPAQPPEPPTESVEGVADREVPRPAEGSQEPPAPARPEPILNLSSHRLGPAESSVLSRGLSFCPTPVMKHAHIALLEDLQRFARSLRWRYFFATDPDAQADSDIHPSLRQFKKPVVFEPASLPSSHPLERYISCLIREFSDAGFLQSLNPRPNLTRAEFSALKTLRSNDSIKIMSADKGSTVVIMDTSVYKAEALRQLSDVSSYERLEGDPTEDFKREISTYVRERGRHEGLSAASMDLLLPEHPRTSVFYTLPKIHKEYSLPDNPPPGRPIVSCGDCLTERISAYLDAHLQPLVVSHWSYL